MKNKLSKLIKLSDKLDFSGLHTHSSRIDLLIKKLAEDSVSTPPVSQPPTPKPTLEYIKGLNTMFGGKEEDIKSYQELKEDEKKQKYSENYAVKNIVDSLIQSHLQNIFSNLRCIKEKPDRDFKDKGGSYSFSVPIKFSGKSFEFTEELSETVNELTNDDTIQDCLNAIYKNKQDINDPTFLRSFDKFKQEAIKKANRNKIPLDFLDQGITYEVSIVLSIKE